MRSDTLDYLEKKGFAKDIKKQFSYVTKLYNEEMHVVASKSIRSLKELDGKTVSVDLPNGGTFVTASIVFERLGLKPKLVYIEQRIALEKLKAGEIDAVVAVQGKPSRAVSQIKDDRLHLVPVDYAKPLQGDYLPASLSAKDYPNLISDQGQIDTIAVPAVLAAYNWAPEDRALSKARIVRGQVLHEIPDLPESAVPSEMEGGSLSAPLPDWQRFPAASNGSRAQDPARGAQPVRGLPEAEDRRPEKLPSDTEREALFKQFQAWEAERMRKAQLPPGQKPSCQAVARGRLSSEGRSANRSGDIGSPRSSRALASTQCGPLPDARA